MRRRRDAAARSGDAEEIVNVAVKSEHTDVAVSALDRVDDAEALSAIAQRARSTRSRRAVRARSFVSSKRHRSRRMPWPRR